jgi:hypothetical protein
MDLARAMKRLYPGVDFVLQDDGNGPYVKSLPAGYAFPTAEQLVAADAEAAVAEQKAARRAEIMVSLDALDFKAIRPLLEGDSVKVADIVAQKAALRQELAAL